MERKANIDCCNNRRELKNNRNNRRNNIYNRDRIEEIKIMMKKEMEQMIE